MNEYDYTRFTDSLFATNSAISSVTIFLRQARVGGRNAGMT